VFQFAQYYQFNMFSYALNLNRTQHEHVPAEFPNSSCFAVRCEVVAILVCVYSTAWKLCIPESCCCRVLQQVAAHRPVLIAERPAEMESFGGSMPRGTGWPLCNQSAGVPTSPRRCPVQEWLLSARGCLSLPLGTVGTSPSGRG